MPDSERIFTALGQLQESVKNIKENTDQIPGMATGLALVKADVDAMKPKVEKHQKALWIGSGVWGAILFIVEILHK